MVQYRQNFWNWKIQININIVFPLILISLYYYSLFQWVCHKIKFGHFFSQHIFSFNTFVYHFKKLRNSSLFRSVFKSELDEKRLYFPSVWKSYLKNVYLSLIFSLMCVFQFVAANSQLNRAISSHLSFRITIQAKSVVRIFWVSFRAKPLKWHF